LATEHVLGIAGTERSISSVALIETTLSFLGANVNTLRPA
jgi:hypothetical protein